MTLLPQPTVTNREITIPQHQDWLSNNIWNHKAISNKTKKLFFNHKCNKPPFLICLRKDWGNEKPTKTVGTTHPKGELSTAKPPGRCFLGDNSRAPIVQKWERKEAFLAAVSPSNTRYSLPVTMTFWRNNGFACSNADRPVAQLQCWEVYLPDPVNIQRPF